jgi:rhodanese-related sulfurtransferase
MDAEVSMEVITVEVTRITVDEVRTRLDRGEPLAMVDARSADAWEKAESQVPGSIRVPPDDVAGHLAGIPMDRAVVTYCTLPNEQSSASVARELDIRGFKDVHALHGGFDAWVRSGLPLEARAGGPAA